MDNHFNYEQVDFNPFGENEILKVAKLTDAQKEMWLSCLLGGDEANLSYNESASLRFSGDLNEEFIWSACERLIERHEALRMSFSAAGDSFLIYNRLEPFTFYRDFSVFSESEKERELKKFLDQEASFVFDLINGPLIRFSLIKLAEKSYLFTITAHHLVCDGWSFGVMFEEIASIYNTSIENRPEDLPSPSQFSQYADDLSKFEQSAEFKEIEAYWLGKYASVPEQLDLPTDMLRPSQRTFQSRRDDFPLPSSLVEEIKNLGKKSKTSLVSTIMAGFEVFLSKISGQNEIVLGLPTAGQAAMEHLVLVGHCVNLLPIRSNIDPESSFEEFLNKRRSEILNDYDHQKYTFGNLINKLNIKRDPSRIPLVPVVFNIDMGMDAQVKFSGLDFTLISNPRKFENFEIFLNLTNQNGNLIVEWSYNTDLFLPETIAYWMEGFKSLFSQMIENPGKPIKKLVLNEELVYEQLQNWNSTFLELPVKNSFLEIFHQNANSFPDQLALQVGEKDFSYLDLRKFANHIAVSIKEKGIGKGDVVAVMLDRNEKILPALLGVLEVGACYVPIDPTFPAERIAYMLEDSGAKLLLTEDHYHSLFEGKISQLLIDTFVNSANTPIVDFSIPEPNDLAYILYTSGSTGKPKGVKVTHLNLLNFLFSMSQNPGMSKGEKLLAITTISFDISGLELYLPLIVGGTVVLANNEESKDGRLLIKKMEDMKIDIMQATPATWRMLMISGWNYPLKFKLLCGGEALSQDLAEKLLGLVGPFWNVYGPTETSIWSSIKHIQHQEEINIGRPIANTQIYILDQEGNPCGVGVVGEICIAGTGVAKGYHNREDLTNEKFVPDPFSKSADAKMYRTGDLGKFLPNGEIVCLGRIDFQVKVRGYRIELGEIEAKLNKVIGIQQAAVNTWEASPGDTRLVGYLVSEQPLNDQQEESIIDDCKNYLKQSLPDYMIPTEWIFMESLPFTNNNKVDRKSLPKPIKKTSPSSGQLSQPNTEIEKLLAGIWEKTLKTNGIGLDADFFSLGGHSLLAVEMMVAVEKETGHKLPVNSVFEFPVFKDFCKLLEPEMGSRISWEVIVPIKPNGKKPPVFLIHGAGANITPFYGLAKILDEDQPVYGIQSKGLNGMDEPLHSIEEMATYYLSEIRKVYPKGPFHLGGQSFGAYVAFEMAKQLKKQNEPIGRIMLFDVPAYQSETKLSGLGKLKMRVNQEIEKRVIDVQLAVNHPDSFKRMKESSFARKGNFLKNWLGVEKDKESNDLFLTIEKIRKINHKAMDEYLLSHYEGSIVLFKAKVKTFLVSEKESYGWKPYAKEVISYDMEGDHNSMIEDSVNVKDFAGKLQEVMDEYN